MAAASNFAGNSATPLRCAPLLNVKLSRRDEKTRNRAVHPQVCRHIPAPDLPAKMGRDAMSVVDAQLKVYGIQKLRIADGSIMPRVTTGNTMAPCTVIGERAAEILRRAHKI